MLLKDKIALITGASAGIGKAIAEAFASEGAKLILVARRKKKIEDLADLLKQKYGTESRLLELDVRYYSKIVEKFKSLDESWQQVDILVNNAGKARGFDKIHEGLLDDWEEMIDTNIKGLLYFSRTVIPSMVKRQTGHIVNIGSIAGEEVYPNGNVYCATKFAVHALSKAMAIDLNGTNVRITNIAPGLVETEFAEVRFHGDKEKAETVYQGYKPLEAADIADIALFCVTRKPHVMIQNVLVTPTDQAAATIVNKRTET